jgi:hypothetical protein
MKNKIALLLCLIMSFTCFSGCSEGVYENMLTSGDAYISFNQSAKTFELGTSEIKEIISAKSGYEILSIYNKNSDTEYVSGAVFSYRA